ncbi:hypothetical protein E2C01_089663 [Portunus trituberculatus]|uniref:Uncharacterized protein n=1 Tax=Portunus trituberculatus TaxID=210409 RepID=A0A5B7JE59_PORTR|nr:hypothetical protein [Portunus trituberculatus]
MNMEMRHGTEGVNLLLLCFTCVYVFIQSSVLLPFVFTDRYTPAGGAW